MIVYVLRKFAHVKILDKLKNTRFNYYEYHIYVRYFFAASRDVYVRVLLYPSMCVNLIFVRLRHFYTYVNIIFFYLGRMYSYYAPAMPIAMRCRAVFLLMADV